MDNVEADIISLQLTGDAAVVLDSFLSQFDAGEEASMELRIQHPAERAAVWALQGALESVLRTPFHPDYDRLLSQAQRRLCDKAGL
jgi:hypothetical protein